MLSRRLVSGCKLISDLPVISVLLMLSLLTVGIAKSAEMKFLFKANAGEILVGEVNSGIVTYSPVKKKIRVYDIASGKLRRELKVSYIAVQRAYILPSKDILVISDSSIAVYSPELTLKKEFKFSDLGIVVENTPKDLPLKILDESNLLMWGFKPNSRETSVVKLNLNDGKCKVMLSSKILAKNYIDRIFDLWAGNDYVLINVFREDKIQLLAYNLNSGELKVLLESFGDIYTFLGPGYSYALVSVPSTKETKLYEITGDSFSSLKVSEVKVIENGKTEHFSGLPLEIFPTSDGCVILDVFSQAGAQIYKLIRTGSTYRKVMILDKVPVIRFVNGVVLQGSSIFSLESDGKVWRVEL